jgi:hypothetical protein
MTTAASRSVLREPGFWLALLLIAAQAINALRVALDPTAFAAYYGRALAAGVDPGWVSVYGLRTTFIAVLAGLLLWRRELRTLALLAWCALLLPVGDLWLVAQAGAPTPTLARHAAIGVVLLLAALALSRWAARAAQPT